MTEISVLLMLFDNKTRMFSALKDMKLPAVPVRGDKISLNDENGIGQIYSVYDVHYGELGIDVNLVHIGNITDYYGSGYPEIEEKADKTIWGGF